MKHLIRHFFAALFEFGILSQAGSDAFRRVLIGIIAVLLTFGLLLARMYSIGPTARSVDAYRLASVAGEALMIGVPMLVVAFATLLVSHSLFPDETDFRVLLVLPISRLTVFLSKLLALALFAGLFIVSTQIAMLPLALRLSAGRFAQGSFTGRIAAHLAASASASIFVVFALTAINGVLLLGVPRARLHAASTAFRSLTLCALVLSVPLVARLPATAGLIAAQSPLLYLAPPLWFVGIQQELSGQATPLFARLAQIGAVACAGSVTIAAITYAVLYRRFDRVMLQRVGGGARKSAQLRLYGVRETRPGAAAISLFTHATLARSPLHQGVFIAISAAGAGLVMNSLIGVRAIPRLQTYEQALAYAVTWTPFALTFAMTLAVRAALVLPIEPRANWVFRMTDNDSSRVEQINAVVDSMVRLGVVAPLAILLPIEWAIFRWDGLICTSVALCAGLVLVELEMQEWNRIPFTCSYMPGKRFVGLTMLIGFAALTVFTTIGSVLVYLSRRSDVGWLTVLAVLGAVVWERRHRRARLSHYTPLVFEDVLPTEVEPLRLGAY